MLPSAGLPVSEGMAGLPPTARGLEFRTIASATLPLPDVESLWAETLGDERIGVAVLDGPVDGAHRSFRGARLHQLEGLVAGACDAGPACRHGTHVASVLFGQHDGPVKGVAPRCRGVLLPIFESVDAQSFRPCSQLD